MATTQVAWETPTKPKTYIGSTLQTPSGTVWKWSNGQYVQQAAETSSGGGQGGAGGSSSSDFATEIQKRLMEQVDIMSSEDSAAESYFDKSIQDLEGAYGGVESGISARFERLRQEEAETGTHEAINAMEGRAGFATLPAVLRNIKDDTEKDLRELDLMEQEALATGRVELAGKIADMKLQKLQFNENLRQNTLTNLLNLANFNLTSQQSTQEIELNNLKLFSSRLDLLANEITSAGSFSALDPTLQSELVNNATKYGIDAATARKMVDSLAKEPNLQFQTVGRSLVSITPDGKLNVLYTAPTDPTAPTSYEIIRNGRNQVDEDLMGIAGQSGGYIPDDIFKNYMRAWGSDSLGDVEEFYNLYRSFLSPASRSTIKSEFGI